MMIIQNMSRPLRFLFAFFLLFVASAAPAWAQDVLQPAERPDWTAPLPQTADGAMQQDTIDAPQTVPVVPQNLSRFDPAHADFDPAALDLSEIPDVILKEMDQIQKNCQENYFYSNFHDCRCIAIKFLDARIKSNPVRSKESVLNTVQNQCADEVAVAGFIYRGCSSYLSYKAPEDFEGVCSCAANDVARQYVRAPFANMRYIENLRRDAYVECGLGEVINRTSARPPLN